MPALTEVKVQEASVRYIAGESSEKLAPVYGVTAPWLRKLMSRNGVEVRGKGGHPKNHFRKNAAAKGDIYYTSNVPCKRGHTAKRFTVSKNCTECALADNIRYQKTEAGKRTVSKAQKRYRASPLGQSYYANNREKVLAWNRKWKERYPEKARLASAVSGAFRRAAELNATPAWSDVEAIKLIYKNRPPGFHVDHIIPLVNKKVCGLHVSQNLQYLTASENSRKSNTFKENFHV